MNKSKIYVGNLPIPTTAEELAGVFEQFGEIKEIALIPDRYTGAFRGFGFITFADEQAAEASLSMNEQDFGGRKMIVNIAKEPEKRSGGFGGGRGGFGGGGGGGGRGGFGGGGGGGGGRSGGRSGGGHGGGGSRGGHGGGRRSDW